MFIWNYEQHLQGHNFIPMVYMSAMAIIGRQILNTYLMYAFNIRPFKYMHKIYTSHPRQRKWTCPRKIAIIMTAYLKLKIVICIVFLSSLK